MADFGTGLAFQGELSNPLLDKVVGEELADRKKRREDAIANQRADASGLNSDYDNLFNQKGIHPIYHDQWSQKLQDYANKLGELQAKNPNQPIRGTREYNMARAAIVNDMHDYLESSNYLNEKYDPTKHYTTPESQAVMDASRTGDFNAFSQAIKKMNGNDRGLLLQTPYGTRTDFPSKFDRSLNIQGDVIQGTPKRDQFGMIEYPRTETNEARVRQKAAQLYDENLAEMVRQRDPAILNDKGQPISKEDFVNKIAPNYIRTRQLESIRQPAQLQKWQYDLTHAGQQNAGVSQIPSNLAKVRDNGHSDVFDGNEKIQLSQDIPIVMNGKKVTGKADSHVTMPVTNITSDIPVGYKDKVIGFQQIPDPNNEGKTINQPVTQQEPVTIAKIALPSGPDSEARLVIQSDGKQIYLASKKDYNNWAETIINNQHIDGKQKTALRKQLLGADEQSGSSSSKSFLKSSKKPAFLK